MAAKEDKVLEHTRRIENLLRTHYHAKGDGLSDLIACSEERLPQDVIERLHKIALVDRHIAINEPLENEAQFLAICQQCTRDLTPRSYRVVWGLVFGLVCGFTLLAIVFYSMHWNKISIP